MLRLGNYSSGWKSIVDGQDVEVVPTNIARRGNPIASGQHRIVLEYDPPSLRYGLLVSLATHLFLICLVFALVFRWIRCRAPVITH